MKFSILTISYNQGSFLKEAINSVINQKYKNTEYIIIDAGSTDNSRDIINHYKDFFSHIIFEPDNGPADGLNKGLQKCTGDIFCYLNADDKFLPGAFNYVETYFTKDTLCDCLLGSAYIIDKNGRKRIRKRSSTMYSPQRIMDGTAIGIQQATFIKTSALKNKINFNVQNTTSWDGELLVDLCLNKATFRITKKALGEFRIYNESITGSNSNRLKYEEDRKRIENKVIKIGENVVKKGKSWRRLINKIDPIRRLYEFI